MNIYEWAAFNKARVAVIYLAGILVGIGLAWSRQKRKERS